MSQVRLDSIYSTNSTLSFRISGIHHVRPGLRLQRPEQRVLDPQTRHQEAKDSGGEKEDCWNCRETKLADKEPDRPGNQEDFRRARGLRHALKWEIK